MYLFLLLLIIVESSYMVLGLIGAASFILETISYFAVPGLIKYFGYDLITLTGVITIGIRYLVYTATENVWWFIIADCLKGKVTGRGQDF